VVFVTIDVGVLRANADGRSRMKVERSVSRIDIIFCLGLLAMGDFIGNNRAFQS